MFTLGNHQIVIGSFHDHWHTDPAILGASLTYYHLDFVCLQSSVDASAVHSVLPNTRIIPSTEPKFGWGHAVLAGAKADGLDAVNPDWRAEFRKMQASGGLVIFAHPFAPYSIDGMVRSGAIDEMLDGNLADAVQPEFSPPEIEWIIEQERRGRRLRIVSGWDVHMLKDLPNLPQVLYTKGRPPQGHADRAGLFRTLVIDSDVSIPSLKSALREGRTVCQVNHGPLTGQLFGPRALIEELKALGIEQKLADLDSRRDEMTLQCDGPCIARQSMRLRFSEPGSVRIQMEQGVVASETDGQGNFHLDRLPLLADNPTFHSLIGFTARRDGAERAFALRIAHPIQVKVDVRSRLLNNERILDLHLDRHHDGKILVRPDGEEPVTFPPDVLTRICGSGQARRAIRHSIEVHDQSGLVRKSRGYATFMGIPRFTGTWDGVPEYDINGQAFVGGYGTHRPYPGPDQYACTFAFAWDERAFRFRAKVTDPVHHQPSHGHFMYQGDALQLFLDMFNLRSEDYDTTWCYTMGLTSTGPELWRWRSPAVVRREGFVPPPADVSLGSTWIRIAHWHRGLVYEVDFPWTEFGSIVPQPGSNIGVFFMAKNNNGSGLIDSFQWPRAGHATPPPSEWGMMTLQP